ncbi:MAG: hypothetical protein GC179_12110 [Anaerolineaceae bacterium]|nr:hypothetical protein [Anaerolineaceae bacterium]
MTLAEVLQQAQTLSAHERKELVKLLVDSLEFPEPAASSHPKTGVQIAALLNQMAPIEFVDPEIEDPVEWVNAQRRKEANRLAPYWKGDK